MRHVSIAASRRYDVGIGARLSCCGEAIRSATGCQSAVVVTDTNVAPLYLARVEKTLTEAGVRTLRHIIPAGEHSKSPAEYLRLLSFLAEQEITRADAVVALGGGVVGDLAGFAAATYLRGLAYVQLPTTLLAMVDSSVGGKTAIDLPAGKNLCGAFYQPWAVLCDCQTLDTLPQAVFADGCAEVIKYGLLRDPKILSLLLHSPESHMLELVERCVQVKGALVERDERDTGLRQFLNLGHTVGHAIEQHSGFSIPHGRAVAMGLGVITRAAVANGDCDPAVLDTLCRALSQCALPDRTDVPLSALSAILRTDKKRQGDQLTLVIPQKLGLCALKTLPLSALDDYLQAGF